ncbi:hypothetical protein BCR34DRAFT_629300 [Clohesyomyces aquaticus]|uniref:Major facilitator superfamily domain-containing protein n=1 Tax=Clohesyomyces aquaticus TaxID=1231657 RepID=A0A1Y1Y6Z7_9PLEO|nr:hypothetical protein BCR34DRAFT_629300 [Clohesyomyces aquaticus]
METKKPIVEDVGSSVDYGSGEAGPIIYIDPAREVACRKKLDIYFVPFSVIFLVLSILDGNNLGNSRFGNINTLSSVCTIRWRANKSISSVSALWSSCTLRTAFTQIYGQAIAAFTYLFTTIYPRELAGKRIMTTNLAQRISSAFGSLFAYAFLITIAICGVNWVFLPTTPEDTWFLNEEEKETIRLKKQRDSMLRGEDKFESKWIKIALTDPFCSCPRLSLALGKHCYLARHIYRTLTISSAISLVIQVTYSEKFKRRGIFVVCCCIPVAVVYLISVVTSNAGAGYAGMSILVLGLYPISTLAVTWIATNLSPDSKRAIGMPFAYSITNVSNVVSSQLYPSKQNPQYIRGNAVSAGLTVVPGFLYGASWLLLRRRKCEEGEAYRGRGDDKWPVGRPEP